MNANGTVSGGGSGGSGNEEEDGDSSGDDIEESANNYPGSPFSDANDVFLGAIVEETLVNKGATKYYDEFTNNIITYSSVKNRYFNTMATFIYNSLTEIYGDSYSGSYFTLSGYNASGDMDVPSKLRVDYSDVLTSGSMQATIGLGYGGMSNSGQLNWNNSINGGYDLEINKTDTTDESGNTATSYNSYSWDTSSVKTENAWVGQSRLTVYQIQKDLEYIYANMVGELKYDKNGNPYVESEIPTINVVNDDIIFNSQSDLKNYYTSFTGGDYTENYPVLTLTYTFEWNVAYYIAYTLIGEQNINNSINNYSTVFSGTNTIRPFADDFCDETVETAFENYKGYNVVVRDLVQRMFNLATVSYTESTTDTTTDISWVTNTTTSLFPKVLPRQVLFYDNLEDIAIGGGGWEEIFNEGEDNESSISYVETPDASASESSEFAEAVIFRTIYLIPYVSSKYIEETGNSTFNFGGLLMGLQRAQDYGNTLNINIAYGCIFNNGNKIELTEQTNTGITNNYATIYGFLEGVDTSTGQGYGGNTLVSVPTQFCYDYYIMDVYFDNMYDMFKADSSNVFGDCMYGNTSASTIIGQSFTSQKESVHYVRADETREFDVGYLNLMNNTLPRNSYNELDFDKNIISMQLYESGNNTSYLQEALYCMFFMVY